MSKLVKKNDIVIVIGSYQGDNGEEKKQFRNIGELITMKDEQGQFYSFGKLWGPGGVTEFRLYEQKRDDQKRDHKPSTPPQRAGSMKDAFDDDIPF